MKIGVFAPFTTPQCTGEFIGEFSERAEQAGMASLMVGEHVVMIDDPTFKYPGADNGKLPISQQSGFFDPASVLAFVAARTKTMRIGTGVILVPQRNPVYTAKEFSSLDWLSNGRVDLGVGIGWNKEEAELCGYSFEDRGKRCDEALALYRKFWSEPVTEFDGEFFKVTASRMDPKPVQKNGIPLIIGGHSKFAYRRAARHGDGWHGFQLSVEDTAAKLDSLDKALAEEGRSIRDDNFKVILTPRFRVSVDMAKEYEELGVNLLVPHIGTNNFGNEEKVYARLSELEALANAFA